MRGLLQDGRFTKEVGSYLAVETKRVYEQTQNMNNGMRQPYQAQETAKLERLWGKAIAASLTWRKPYSTR